MALACSGGVLMAAAGQRHFSTDAMDGYKASAAFDYVSITPQGMSLWDRFWFWVFSLLAEFFSGPNGQGIAQVLYIAFLLVVIVGAVYFFIRLQYGPVFARSNDSAVGSFSFAPGRQAPNYDQLIDDALQAGDTRLAIRYLYQKGITLLGERGLLKLRPWKTGADYAVELRAEPAQHFAQLRQIFEYTWYGEFEPDQQDLQQCQAVVKALDLTR